MEQSLIMRVALNCEQLLNRPPGGIGRYTAELARLLPGPDPDVGDSIEVLPFVARHRQSSIDAAFDAFGLTAVRPVRLLLPRPVLYDTWNVLGVPPLGMLHPELRDIDVVHAPSLAVPPHAAGVPLIVTAHDTAPLVFPDTYPARGRWFHRRGLLATARRADLVITPSQAAADEIVRCTTIKPERIRVVPHGVTQRRVGDDVIATARAALGIGDDPYVLWVGTLEPRKNLPRLLEAFRAVVRAGRPERLVLVGPPGWRGGPKVVAAAAAALGDRVHFTGPLQSDRLIAVYRGATLFAFPSLHEGFGLPVLEAMAQAVPVLCSDIPVLREVAGDAVAFAPASNTEVWSQALVDLLSDEPTRRALAAAGRERASAFTWGRCIRRTRGLYREVLARAG